MSDLPLDVNGDAVAAHRSVAGDLKQGELDAYCSTGSSPTVHLLGPGRVGRAFLDRLRDIPVKLVAVTDSTATLHDPDFYGPGLSLERIAAHKESGRGLAVLESAQLVPAAKALQEVEADVVVDLTATDFHRPEWSEVLHRSVLDRGATLILAAKDALCASADRWFDPSYHTRVGYNAVLGGTGRALQAELHELRSQWCSAAVAGNASTTTIVQAVERGASLEEGIQEASGRGLLEADPELDLQGRDAAVKLAIVAGALSECSLTPSAISPQDIRTIDLQEVRERPVRGATTRLVGRVIRDPEVQDLELQVTYEEVPLDSPLAAPADRVAYTYELQNGDLRVHTGGGLGSERTAEAALVDLECLLPFIQRSRVTGGVA